MSFTVNAGAMALIMVALGNRNSATDDLIKCGIENDVPGMSDLGADFDANGNVNGEEDSETDFYNQAIDLFDAAGYGIDESEDSKVTIYKPEDITVSELESATIDG